MIKTGDLTTSMVQTAIQCLHSEEILLYFQRKNSGIQSKINSKYNMLNVVGCAAEVKIYFFIPETSSPLLIKKNYKSIQSDKRIGEYDSWSCCQSSHV